MSLAGPALLRARERADAFHALARQWSAIFVDLDNVSRADMVDDLVWRMMSVIATRAWLGLDDEPN